MSPKPRSGLVIRARSSLSGSLTTRPTTSVLSFNSATAVANYYGATSSGSLPGERILCRLQRHFRDNAVHAIWHWMRRPHLLGANISNLTLNQLQSISGSLAITFQGYTYSGPINLSGVESFSGGRERNSGCAQFALAGRGRDGRKFDHAGLGFVHGIAQLERFFKSRRSHQAALNSAPRFPDLALAAGASDR